MGRHRQPDTEPKHETLALRMFVRPHRDHFFACCVDLDIAVEADTPVKACQRLDHAIKSYLRTATNEEGPAGFTYRRAPLPVIAEYYEVMLIGGALRCRSKIRRLQSQNAHWMARRMNTPRTTGNLHPAF